MLRPDDPDSCPFRDRVLAGGFPVFPCHLNRSLRKDVGHCPPLQAGHPLLATLLRSELGLEGQGYDGQ